MFARSIQFYLEPIKLWWTPRHVAIGSRQVLDAVKPTLWRLHLHIYSIIIFHVIFNSFCKALSTACMLTLCHCILGNSCAHCCSPFCTKRAQGCASKEVKREEGYQRLRCLSFPFFCHLLSILPCYSKCRCTLSLCAMA